MSRERAVDWMARRERGTCPQRPVTREQCRQTVQRALALRVALAFCRFDVGRHLFRDGAAGTRPRRAWKEQRIGSNATWPSFSTGSSRSVVARQEICATALELREELFG